MPLADRDPNASGRTSRASNMSAGSRGLQKGHGAGSAFGRSDLLPAAPGVMSMLRTSTELGDIGPVTYDSHHLPNVPRAPARRMGATSRMSTGSSRSNASRRTSAHNARPSASSGARRSLTTDQNMPQYVADTLSPTIMNFPGSSPLIPHTRNSRDGRSLSMTHTSQPTFRLSSNRSLISLRAHPQDHVPRPRSPYHYPTRLRRPGYRPASPAMSDVTGTHPRRLHGRGHSTQHSMHSRLRTPSNLSIHRDDRPSITRFHGGNKSPTFLMSPHRDVPPVPPLHHHILVEQARIVHTSANPSVSSGSTNRRTDSDVPSSEAPPSPPTPKDGTSMEVLISPTNTQLISSSIGEVAKLDTTKGPLFYDYSEAFETEPYVESDAGAVRTGFVHRIKTILEERATLEQTPNKADVADVQPAVGTTGSDVPKLVELPASPVPRRITRNMVLEALQSTNSSEEAGTYELGFDSKSSNELVVGVGEVSVENSSATRAELHLSPKKGNGINQWKGLLFEDATTMTVPDSSTLDFAARYSIPMIAGTEDGMSDLLDDYQHTEQLQSTDTSSKEGVVEAASERKSNHTSKSSDEQSFKCCTDVTEQQPYAYKHTPAKSFKTCKDSVTPDRVISMPATIIPSSGYVSLGSTIKRPISEMPLSAHPIDKGQQPAAPLCEASSAKPVFQDLQIFKTRSRHSSISTSAPSSVVTITPQPPTVPQGESSSSKEAQRSTAVADFLIRLSRANRFSKAHASFGRKSKDDDNVASDVSDKEKVKMPQHNSPREKRVVSISKPRSAVLETPEKDKGTTCPDKRVVAKSLDLVSTSMLSQHPFSHPTPVIVASSSVYSSVRMSPPEIQVQPLPVVPFASSDEVRCDSQSTTQLVCHVRRSTSSNASNAPEIRIIPGNNQERITTDSRLSACRYPLNYLPDLKEESHEDSSINTNASNLKRASFRYPLGHSRGVGASPSMDNSVVGVGRNPSVRSAPQSGLAQTRGLPSMNFSRMDLIAKLNEALEKRSSRSLEVARDVVEPIPATPSPVRPVSVGEMREKYRSFFASLDGFEKHDNVAQSNAVRDLMSMSKGYSPDELLAEIDQLTIPSVGGLTQRLSEFLPSLKEYYKLGEEGNFLAEQIIMEHAMEELEEVGGPAPKRSSARLRPMPGSPNLVVIDDGLYEELTVREGDNLPMEGIGQGRSRGLAPDLVPTKSVLVAGARETTPPAELEAPSPAVRRTRSLSVGPYDLRGSLESRLSSRSLRSVASTPTVTDTRPWNSDKNYPWAGTLPSIDISLPPKAATRGSPGPSRPRIRVSASSGNASNLEDSVVSPARAKMPMSGPDDPFTHTRRRSHRFSYLSYSRRPNNTPLQNSQQPTPGFDHSGFPTGPLKLRGDNPAHDVGERYPTSALTPPSGFTVNGDSQSHFSDDSSEDGRPTSGGVRRTITHLRQRLTPSNRSRLAMTANNSIQDQEGEARDFKVRRETFEGAAGMPTKVYLPRKLMEKTRLGWRSILRKSGEFVRKLSKRKPPVKTGFPANVEGSGDSPSLDHKLSKVSRDLKGSTKANKAEKKRVQEERKKKRQEEHEERKAQKLPKLKRTETRTPVD